MGPGICTGEGFHQKEVVAGSRKGCRLECVNRMKVQTRDCRKGCGRVPFCECPRVAPGYDRALVRSMDHPPLLQSRKRF